MSIRCEHSTHSHGTCGRPARWLSPARLHVCGIHKRAAESFYAATGRALKCEPLSLGKEEAPSRIAPISLPPPRDYAEWERRKVAEQGYRMRTRYQEPLL